MITLDCPICSDPVEFTFDPGEDAPTVDEIRQECECKWSDEERGKLIKEAEESIEDIDPPGDY